MSTPPPNFDRVARIYRWSEYLALGRTLERIREHFLPQVNLCRQALAIGDGDGRFLARLLHQNPQLQALAVDTSAAMLAQLSVRCTHAGQRLKTSQASALTITPPPTTDLIVTHFFLDCLTQPDVDALTYRLASHLAPGTLWLLSDFGSPQPRALRPLAWLYVRSLYLAFRILTGLRVTRLPDPQISLTHAGFTRLARHESLQGLLYTELWQRQELPHK
jgi:hypothetical protein